MLTPKMKITRSEVSRRTLIGSGALSIAAHSAKADTNSLDAAVEHSHRALAAILNGNPQLYQELFADRDDVTLGNPFGPFARGRENVVKTLASAASKYRNGSVVKVDLVAKYVGGKMACLVEVEHDRAKVGGSNEFDEFSVRVTSLYQLIGDDWKLVHRHADPITTPRPAESVLQK